MFHLILCMPNLNIQERTGSQNSTPPRMRLKCGGCIKVLWIPLRPVRIVWLLRMQAQKRPNRDHAF
jgi:hypothetical protein